ncbi:MAG: TldD/PmbA family protein [Ahrensia sp.]|nr:TldD/PmbA family protein [Ahrensia sp.]
MTDRATDEIDLNTLSRRAEQLVAAARASGADAADAVVAAGWSSNVDIRQTKVEEALSSQNSAFTLRAFVGQRSASVSANETGDPAALAERCVAMARVAPQDPHSGLADLSDVGARLPDLDLYDDARPDFDTMTSLALECEEAALSVFGVSKSSGASCGHAVAGTVLVTSNGFCGSYRSSRFSLSMSCVAGEHDAMERDYAFDTCRHFGDLRAASTIGLEAGKRAAKRVGASQISSGTATVVFEPRVARSLVSHLASATNGRSVVRGTSFLRDDRGSVIFPEDVSIVDEPHVKRGIASRPFDAEGHVAEDLKLVCDGRLENWLLDGATARQLGLTSNARANRSGSSTVPGSTNLTLMPGSNTTRELIANVRHGIFVTELIGQGVSLVTGDYSRGASGFLIEKGEITRPVSEITIAGNLRNMFGRLRPGDDLDMRLGTNAPTIAIEGMTVAGS